MSDWTDLPGQVLRFAVVGLANTAVGLSVIAALLAKGVDDYVANMAGYAAGLMLSLILNRSWTFGATNRLDPREAAVLIALYGFSYTVSLAVLMLMRTAGYHQSILSHLAAMISYSVMAFTLLRLFTIRGAR